MTRNILIFIQLIAILVAAAPATAADDAPAIERWPLERLWETGEYQGCDLRFANLASRHLGESKLEEADLTGAKLAGTKLAGAQLSRSRSATRRKGCRLTGSKPHP